MITASAAGAGAPAEAGAEATTATPTATPTGAPRAPLWSIAGPGVAVGAATALWGISRQALWLDEAYSLGAVHQLGRTLGETSGTMGAYYLVLAGWLQVSESVWWMRSLSVLLALAALVAAAALARRIAGDRTARLAAVLTPLAYLWLPYSREARSYALVMVLAAGAWLALDHALAAPDDRTARRWWWLVTALTAVVPLAHGLGLLQVLPQAVVLLAAGAGRTAWLRWWRGAGAGLAVTAFLVAFGANEVGDWVAPLSPGLAAGTLRLFTSPHALVALLLTALVAVGVADRVGAARAAAPGLARARALVPVAWAFGPVVLIVLLSVARPSLVPRYVVGILPALALLEARGLEAVGARIPALRRPAIAVVLALLVLGHVETHREPVDGWTTATRLVAAEARPGDTVLFAGDESRPPFEAAWRHVADAPDLAPTAGARPLGEVIRFEPGASDDTAHWRDAAEAGRVWLVAHSTLDDPGGAVAALTEGPGASHRVAAAHHPGEGSVTVVLLVPR